MFDGSGTLKLKNWVFRGQFYKNKIEGMGVLQIADKKIMGKWANNRFIQHF